MRLYIEDETGTKFPFSIEEVAGAVCEAVLEKERCPYEVQVNVVLTDNEGIREINRAYRDLDQETDVLSFPMLEYDSPSDFSWAEAEVQDCFNPETGELLLVDIIISMEKMREQAKKYGHSEKREFAFLITHSMLHLFGYDHMEPDEAKEMENRQEAILHSLNILR